MFISVSVGNQQRYMVNIDRIALFKPYVYNNEKTVLILPGCEDVLINESVESFLGKIRGSQETFKEEKCPN